jgi:flagellar biosynthesis/type III secretory pathway chaperone
VSAMLQEILSQEMEKAHALLDVLLGERDALNACDVDSLVELAGLKEDLSRELERLAQNHRMLLAKLGIDGRSRDLAQSLRDTNRQELISIWRRLTDLLTQCQAQNTCNSHIITSLRRYHHAVLAIVHRQSGCIGLYDGSGRTQAFAPQSYSSFV